MSYADIHAIYLATEGEGVLIGTPQVFVRFQGCSIGCINCDSIETWAFDKGRPLLLDQVIEEISRAGLQGKVRRVSFTGGDPLHPKHRNALIELIKQLKKKNYSINVEAAGTQVVHEVFDLVDLISFDIKTPSTGVRFNRNVIAKMFDQYLGRFQIKAVVQDKKDFDFVFEQFQNMPESKKVQWSITPSFMKGEMLPFQRITDIMEWNYQAGAPFRIICQQHKFIYGPDQNNV